MDPNFHVIFDAASLEVLLDEPPLHPARSPSDRAATIDRITPYAYFPPFLKRFIFICFYIRFYIKPFIFWLFHFPLQWNYTTAFIFVK